MASAPPARGRFPVVAVFRKGARELSRRRSRVWAAVSGRLSARAPAPASREASARGASPQRAGWERREEEFPRRVAVLSAYREVSVGVPRRPGSVRAADWVCQALNTVLVSRLNRMGTCATKAESCPCGRKETLAVWAYTWVYAQFQAHAVERIRREADD